MGNIAAVGLLLEHDVDIDACSPSNRYIPWPYVDVSSALTVAVLNKHNAVANFLLRRGADVGADKTLLSCIHRFCDLTLVKYLVATGASRRDLDIAFEWEGDRFDRDLALAIIKAENLSMIKIPSKTRIKDCSTNLRRVFP